MMIEILLYSLQYDDRDCVVCMWSASMLLYVYLQLLCNFLPVTNELESSSFINYIYHK